MNLAKGRLIIGHRPRLRGLKAMRESGITDVLTLLSEKEGATAMGDAMISVGLKWHWLPLPNGRPPPKNRNSEILEMLHSLRGRLAEGAFLFIHCSAGIHRTGMITSALLALEGWDETGIRDGLREMRAVTAEAVGEERIKWAVGLSKL